MNKKRLILFIVGAFYIANLTAGIIEFIPDNAPLIGNLDEAVFAFMLLPFLVEDLNLKFLKF